MGDTELIVSGIEARGLNWISPGSCVKPTGAHRPAAQRYRTGLHGKPFRNGTLESHRTESSSPTRQRTRGRGGRIGPGRCATAGRSRQGRWCLFIVRLRAKGLPKLLREA